MEQNAGPFIGIVIRIQRAFRWNRRWGLIREFMKKRVRCAKTLQKRWRLFKLCQYAQKYVDKRIAARKKL